MRSSPPRSEPSGRLRLDLFLKRSGLVRRRTLAALLCDNGHVLVNGRPAPPGHAVRAGDTLRVRYARKAVTVKVESLPARGRPPSPCFTVVLEETIDED